MTWVNLNDLYLPLAGGVIDGDLTVNGALSNDDFNAIKNMLTHSYVPTTTATYADNWSQSGTPSCYLIGNQLRCYMYATRTSAIGTGNITNEKVCTLSIDTNNRVKSVYTVGFTNAVEGGVATFYTRNISTTDGVVSFDVTITATASSSSAYSCWFVVPAVLNINGFK